MARKWMVSGVVFASWMACVSVVVGVEAKDLGGQLTAKAAAAAPTLDGKADDWKDVAPIKVKVVPARDKDAKNYTGTIEVDLRAVTHGENIYFLAEWPDKTKDAEHKTLQWDKEKDGYVETKVREDRFVLRFDMGGDFEVCMLSGTAYKVDVWHWKAYRSQTVGVAHDKSHTFSTKEIPLAKKHKSLSGKDVWVARPSDAGDSLYKSQRPIDNIGDRVPRYLPNKAAKGSVVDVKSAAVWADGKWTLELCRKLDTGNDDDVKFEKGKTYRSGLAAFDHTGDDHHSTGSFALTLE